MIRTIAIAAVLLLLGVFAARAELFAHRPGRRPRGKNLFWPRLGIWPIELTVIDKVDLTPTRKHGLPDLYNGSETVTYRWDDRVAEFHARQR